MSVSRRLRFEILRRDSHACRYCGATAPDVALTVDHVVPVALGGDDAPSNLVTACASCNAGKSSSSPDAPIVDNVADDALRWAKAIARVAALQAARADEAELFVYAFDDTWSQWVFGAEPGHLAWHPTDYRISLRHFFELGLTEAEVKDAVNGTLPRSNLRGHDGQWRYFCGVCWGTLRKRQEMARDMLDSEGA